MSGAAAVELCVHGDALWHRVGLAALGVGWQERGGVGRRLGDTVPVYLAAMTLAPPATAAELSAAAEGLRGRLYVADSFARLDLAPLGWRFGVSQPWMLREPPHAAPVVPAGVSIAAVRTAADVETFERTIFEAADGNPDWAPRGSVHPAEASLTVPGMTLLIAWLEGAPVGTSMAVVDERVVQVGGVSVLPAARRRGIGAALTAAAAALGPSLPAVLSSTRMGHGVYRGLGFHDVGTRGLWGRDG